MSSLCFHCELEVPSNCELRLEILGQSRLFCCPGCLAVAQTICDNQLESFYQYRSQANQKVDEILPQELFEIDGFNNPSITNAIVENQGEINEVELGIEGIQCAACGWLIRQQLGKLKGITDVQVNISTRRAKIRFSSLLALSVILTQIRALGYKAYPFSAEAHEKALLKENDRFLKRLLVAGLAMMQVMMYAVGGYIGEFQDIAINYQAFLHLVSGVLATPVAIYSAQPFYQSAWRSLKLGHLDMNLPISLAIIISYSSSIFSLITSNNIFYFDSLVMFTFFLLLGRFIEHRATMKAILKQQTFKKLLPLVANRLDKNGGSTMVALDEIKPGDQIIVNAGCIVPVDGVLMSENAEVNESILSGEFLPVKKQTNDSIVSGSTNLNAGLLISASTTPSESRLQSLIKLQHNVVIQTDPQTPLVDKIARWYVQGLFGICLIAAAIWWQIDPVNIYPVILSLLVVTCPCALSLATPTAIAAAIARLSDRGLLIKASHTLNDLAHISDVYLDKTGTLTMAEMSISKIVTHSTLDQQSCVKIAASLEKISNHPVAQAFHHLNLASLEHSELKEVIGGGVQGCIDGKRYRLGSAEFVTAEFVSLALASSELFSEHLVATAKAYKSDSPASSLSLESRDIENYDKAAIKLLLIQNNQHIATFWLTDKVNPSARLLISQLDRQGYKVHMLSGDSEQGCAAVAKALSIQKFTACSTPESKLNQIQQAQRSGKKILMVGDGVNDIGALSHASVGLSVGTANHLTKSSADALLLGYDLGGITEALTTAKKMHQIIKQNFAWALGYNLLAVPFAAAGLIPPWLAAIGMTASSLIVVLNTLRLRY